MLLPRAVQMAQVARAAAKIFRVAQEGRPQGCSDALTTYRPAVATEHFKIILTQDHFCSMFFHSTNAFEFVLTNRMRRHDSVRRNDGWALALECL